jgi:hypothetical protein
VENQPRFYEGFMRSMVSFSLSLKHKYIMKKSGEVVRWAPNELSFSSAAAWKDIYNPRKSGDLFMKDHKFYITDDK